MCPRTDGGWIVAPSSRAPGPMHQPPVRRIGGHALAGLLATALVLAACTDTQVVPTGVTATPAPAGSNGGGATNGLPAVEGFTYGRAGGAVQAFVDAANQTLAGDGEVQVVDAAVASRGEDEVLVVAWGLPGTDDTRAVDAMARVLDGLEDAFQAGAQRGLGGDAFVLQAEGETVVMAPLGRADFLVFLFAHGPSGATEELATGILNAGAER